MVRLTVIIAGTGRVSHTGLRRIGIVAPRCDGIISTGLTGVNGTGLIGDAARFVGVASPGHGRGLENGCYDGWYII